MRPLLVLLLGPTAVVGLLALSSCQARRSDDGMGLEREAVFFGSDDFVEEGTVSLWSYTGTGCSGSVITPTVILTANHCVEGTVAEDWVIEIGPAPHPLPTHFVTEIVAPGPFTEDSMDDLALLVVNEPLPVPTYHVVTHLNSEVVGTHVRIVGYGLDEEGFSGRRQIGEMSVTRLAPLWLELAGETFPGSGDSGGPVLDAANQVIAVISRAGDNVGVVTRVDRLRWMMDPILHREGGCVTGDPEVCDGVDNNCDREVDEGCTRPGGPCDDDDRCRSGLCAHEATRDYCSRPCDPELPCPETMYCRSGRCVLGSPGEVGSFCRVDEEGEWRGHATDEQR